MTKGVFVILAVTLLVNVTAKRIPQRRDQTECPELGGILPPCPFPDHQESTYHAHPGDCHWFYQCSNGVPYCQECPASLHWNAELEVCDYPYRANCGASGTSAPSTPNNGDSTTAVSSEQPDPSTAKPCPAGRAPGCPFPDPEFSVFFPHENDCHWFYHCSNGVAYCKECPADLHWNVKLETCDYPYRAGCINGLPSNSSTASPPSSTTEVSSSPSDPATDTSDAPNPTESSTTSSATPICPTGNAPQCPFPDPEYLVFFPHENDCQWFYQCANGVAHCKQCPQGLHWNDKKQICDFPENAGCTSGNPSTPASTTEGNSATETEPPPSESPVPTQSTSAPRLCPQGHAPDCPFPDPEFSVFFPHENDCHWFYHCSNGVAYCKECPADLHWNVKLETCDYPYRAGCKTDSPSNSSTAAPLPSTTEENSTPSEPATDTTEAPVPTQSSTTSGATPVCPPGNVPQCPFPDPEYLVFFPHENDCGWFYQCAQGIAHCIQCPQGLHWNNQKQICDYPENAGCASGTPSTSSTTTAENTTPEPATDTEASSSESPNPTQSTSAPIVQCPAGQAPACPFPDPEMSVFFPHENDCGWFYHCSNGVAYCKMCPTGLHWNTNLQTCDYPYRAGCAVNPSTSSTDAPPSSTTEENSTPADPATDTTEAPVPTQSSTTSGATPVCPPGNAPQCPFPDPEYLVFFPHENDCGWFYQCAQGIAHCIQCPQGLHWNNQKQICDYPENAGCASGTPSTSSTTTAENTTPEPATDTEASSSESPNPTQSTSAPIVQCPAGQAPACPFPDPELSVFFPHENDCGWFYHCSNGVAYCKMCPTGLHWNTNLQTCDYPYRAGCAVNPSTSSTDAPPSSTTEENSSPADPATDTTETPVPTQSSTTSGATPVCPPGNAPQCPFPDPEYLVFFPHENDCGWFYQCAQGIAHCIQCPQGLHWNNQKQICDYPENAGCASGTPSTSSTTTAENTTPEPATDTEASSSESPNPTQSTSAPIVQCPAGQAPACPFPDPDLSVFFPHENDCGWFYHCSNGVAYCKMCPTGLHWNAKLDTCDYPYRAGCAITSPPESSSSAPPQSSTQENPSPSEEPTTASPTESSSTIQSTATPCPLGNVPNCPFPDPELSVFFPHENDCHWFYHCSNGVAYCKECPADLHWNTRLETCDYPYRAGCSVASKLHKLH